MKFALSSTAFRGKSVEEMIVIAQEHNLVLEFSSGLPYRKDMQEVYIAATCERMLHNYFPAPEIPFVLNLGSANPDILKKSRDHCMQGLELAAKSNSPFFSAHAGFCLDPDPSALGSTFSLAQLNPREMHWKNFIESCVFLAQQARRLKVRMLFENNVLSPGNYARHSSSPVLCADTNELQALMRELSDFRDSTGLLIDTGHIKVSATTLAFNASESINAIKDLIVAFHHSDNNGLEDSNQPIDQSYWFLPLMQEFPDNYHVLEVHDQSIPQIENQRQLLEGAVLRSTLVKEKDAYASNC